MGRFIDQVREHIPANADFVKQKFLDIRYAEGSDKRFLDIYLPNEGNGPYPVIIDVFGGGFYFGQRSSDRMNLALELLKRGYAVVSIDYSLSKEAKFPTQLYEVKAAIRKIKEIGTEYQLDTARIALMGQSSGGNLCALTALTTSAGQYNDIRFGNTSEDASVNAVVCLYTPTNFLTSWNCWKVLGIEPAIKETGAADSPGGFYLGSKISDIPEIARAASPASYVNENAPAFCFFAGNKDVVVPYLQSQMLAVELMDKIGIDNVEYHMIDGARHNLADFMNETVYDRIDEFLKKHI